MRLLLGPQLQLIGLAVETAGRVSRLLKLVLDLRLPAAPGRAPRAAQVARRWASTVTVAEGRTAGPLRQRFRGFCQRERSGVMPGDCHGDRRSLFELSRQQSRSLALCQ